MKLTKNFGRIIVIVLILTCLLGASSVLFSFGGGSSGGSSGNVNSNNNTYPSYGLGPVYDGSAGRISFLGDSITTYAGYSNSDKYNSALTANTAYYTSSKMRLEDTWWYQTLQELNMSLCVNNSCDASRVTETNDKPSGVERATNLHNGSMTPSSPHIIIIYMGTNDVGNGVDSEVFSESYSTMLSTIQKNYMGADVYCCTLLPESRTFGMLEEFATYNEIIRSSADKYGYKVIDFALELPDWDYTELTFDDNGLRVHPTAEGMRLMADVTVRAIKGDK